MTYDADRWLIRLVKYIIPHDATVFESASCVYRDITLPFIPPLGMTVRTDEWDEAIEHLIWHTEEGAFEAQVEGYTLDPEEGVDDAISSLLDDGWHVLTKNDVRAEYTLDPELDKLDDGK